MSVSGRLSSCSVVQEENLVQMMNKTPGTPIKTGHQVTPRKSESKRCLFRGNSPSGSDDLGLMSPLSPSSCSSNQSLGSPHFSPNGTFTTPPRTPSSNATPTRCSPRISAKKIEVKSSLFPDLKLHTPKSHRTPRTPRSLLSKMLTPQSKVDSVEDIEEGIRSLSTPSTSRSRRKSSFEHNIVAESPSVSSLTQGSEEEDSGKESEEPTKLGVKPLSCESFYGPVPQPPRAKTKLFIDSLVPRAGGRSLVRSQSRDSLSSNKSFVSGGTRKKTSNRGPQQSRRSRSRSSHGKKRKPPHVGVWHNIKKPKQIKKIAKPEKPLVSPKSRVAKMLNSPNKKGIKVKSKPLFQDNPRRRVAHCKKRGRNDSDDDNIIDSFPDHLIKRKKLPTPRNTSHPAFNDAREKTPEKLMPDPNKKFLKYGQTRKAVFTLTDNVKLQISDGVMKIQTPKKRRKLYSGKKDVVEDFNDFDEGDNEVQKSIEGILNRLHSHGDMTGEQDEQRAEKDVYDAPLFHDLEKQKMNEEKNSASKSSSKSQRSPLKTVSNLPSLILNDFESDDNEDKSPVKASQEKSPSEVSLAKTGTMVSYLTNILVNDYQDANLSSENVENESENSPPGGGGGGKYFSLFYRHNWNRTATLNDGSSGKSLGNKRKALVPDDQYLLDAGQKSVGIVTCKKCGVMYQAGDFADEATHNNFHNHISELRFTGWNNERVVGKYPDGRIIMILSSDPKIWWQKVSKILDIVDQELGFPEASLQSLYYKTVYLYINEKVKQIAGCLIAEECKVAYRMFPPLEGVEIDSCSKDPSPCKVGISRIWTALSNRRKGVASRLIDCLQRTFLFGEIVSLDQIAFSVPSPSGFDLLMILMQTELKEEPKVQESGFLGGESVRLDGFEFILLLKAGSKLKLKVRS